jgi:hypothetical protein
LGDAVRILPGRYPVGIFRTCPARCLLSAVRWQPNRRDGRAIALGNRTDGRPRLR